MYVYHTHTHKQRVEVGGWVLGGGRHTEIPHTSNANRRNKRGEMCITI